MKSIFFPLLLLPIFVCGQNPDSIKVAQQIDSLLQVAINSSSSGAFQQMYDVASQAQILAEGLYGRYSGGYSDCLNIRAAAAAYQGRDSLAEILRLEHLQIEERIDGKDHPQYATSLFNLAYLYHNKRQSQKAEPFAKRASSIYLKSLGEKARYYLNSLGLLGSIYRITARFEEAEQVLIEAVTTLESEYGEEDDDYINNLVALASLYKDMAYYDKAELAFLKAQKLMEKKYGEEFPFYSTLLSRLATLYQEVGQYTKAETLFKKTLELTVQVFGKDHSDYTSSLNNLALLYKQMENLDLAAQWYQKALSASERILGKNSPRYASVLLNLAGLDMAKLDYTSARHYTLEAMAIYQKISGKSHPSYANCLVKLGNNYANTGKSEDGEQLLLEAKDIFARSLGEMHPNYQNCLISLARLYLGNNDLAKASPYLLEANARLKSLLVKGTAYLTFAELGEYQNRFKDLNSILATHAAESLEITEELFDNQLFYKGFLLNSSIQVKKLSQTDQKSSERYNLLNIYRRRLGAEYSKPIVERQGVDTLEKKVNELEKELVRTVSGFDQTTRQVSWQEVRASLESGESAVEFVKYKYSDSHSDSNLLYAALIIRPGLQYPVFVPLCNEKELTNLTEDSLLGFDEEVGAQVYSKRLLTRGKNAGKGLYELTWEPIDSFLVNSPTIYVSLTGLLHRINLGAIRTDRTKIIADQNQLITINSTRQLVIRKSEYGKSTTTTHSQYKEKESSFMTPNADSYSSVLYGGLLYDLNPTDTVIGNDRGGSVPKKFENLISFSYLDQSLQSRGLNWTYLPHTDQEIEEIAAIIERQAGEVLKLRGYEGTEEAFKKLGKEAPSPKILHLATHGYFFPDPDDYLTSAEGYDEAPAYRISDHPMIRSGIILAGANYAWRTGKPLTSNGEDGILTAYEISQMNLDSTELVVLSACNTGLGDIKGNEGVFGLQRALKIAGVRNIIMSLWSVPDQQSREIMVSFYEHWLNEKMSINDALRTAQKEMREKYKDHYYWAAFVLIE